MSSVNAFALRGLDLSACVGFLRTSGRIRTFHAFSVEYQHHIVIFVHLYGNALWILSLYDINIEL